MIDNEEYPHHVDGSKLFEFGGKVKVLRENERFDGIVVHRVYSKEPTDNAWLYQIAVPGEGVKSDWYHECDVIADESEPAPIHLRFEITEDAGPGRGNIIHYEREKIAVWSNDGGASFNVSYSSPNMPAMTGKGEDVFDAVLDLIQQRKDFQKKQLVGMIEDALGDAVDE